MVMTVKIKNEFELLKGYLNIHRPEKMNTQVLQNSDSMGTKDMELYLVDYQAFLILDIDPDFDRGRDGAQWATLPREQEWQPYVAKFQKVHPESNTTEKWKLMSPIA